MTKNKNMILWVVGSIAVIALGVITYVLLKPNGSSSTSPQPTPGGGPSPQPTPGGGSVPPVDSGSWLSEHNKYRTKGWDGQGSPTALQWNAELASLASQTAASISASGAIEEGKEVTSALCGPGPQCGKNIEFTANPGSQAVENWYNECSAYHSKNPPVLSDQTGHYAQLMWKTASKVGCGVSGQVAVCLYDQEVLSNELTGNVPAGSNDC